MNWKSVGKSIGKAAPLLGTALGGPLGGVAGAVIASALNVEPTPDAVEAALTADPAALARLREVEISNQTELQKALLEAETNRLATVNATMQMEAASADPYVRRWRPTFGYVMAGAWALQSLTIFFAALYAVVFAPTLAGPIMAAIAETLDTLTTQWLIGLTVLGVAVVQRGKDKSEADGGEASPLMDSLLARLRPRR